MAWTRALIAVGLGLALYFEPAFAPAMAQAEEPETVLRTSSPFMDLKRGDRIRVRLRGGDSFKARFGSATPDSLTYATDKRLLRERSLAFARVEGLDRRTGSHHHVATGALLGLLAGAGIGALISTSEDAGTTQWVATTIYTLAGAGGGLVIGIVAGSCIGADDWAPVWER
jgi:hypothetical protein